MQPILTTSIVRPWQWGIVVVSDSSAPGELPELVRDQLVSANEVAVVVLIRHAQDVDEVELGFAEGTVTVTFHPGTSEERPGHHRVYLGVLSTPRGMLSIGDADMEVMLPAQPGETKVAVSVAETDDPSPDHVWIDIWPAGAP